MTAPAQDAEDLGAIREQGIRAMQGRGPRVPTKVDAYRREHPNTFYGPFFPPKANGYTIRRANLVYFTGMCSCGGIITRLRDTTANRGNPRQRRSSGASRWPIYCDECRQTKAEEHNRSAPERMRRLRAEMKVPPVTRNQKPRTSKSEKAIAAADERLKQAKITERFYQMCKEKGMRDPDQQPL